MLQEVVKEKCCCLTQERRGRSRALRVAGALRVAKSLAQVIHETGALNVYKELITILAEVNQMC